MKIINKRAFRDYQILEKFEAGINLFPNVQLVDYMRFLRNIFLIVAPDF